MNETTCRHGLLFLTAFLSHCVFCLFPLDPFKCVSPLLSRHACTDSILMPDTHTLAPHRLIVPLLDYNTPEHLHRSLQHRSIHQFFFLCCSAGMIVVCLFVCFVHNFCQASLPLLYNQNSLRRNCDEFWVIVNDVVPSRFVCL